MTVEATGKEVGADVKHIYFAWPNLDVFSACLVHPSGPSVHRISAQQNCSVNRNI